MRDARRGTLGLICAAALVLCMMLGGCGASQPTTSGRAAAASTATATAAATATATPSPTAMPSPSSIPELPGCPLDSKPPKYGVVAVGNLKVSIPGRTLDYPSELLPNNLSNAPYQIAASAVRPYAPHPPVNPSLGTGYVFQICNETGVTHALSSMRVNIASFSTRSGPVTVWNICDGPYNAATKSGMGGCGGGYGGTRLAATLPQDVSGASAPVTGATWPVRIGPNKAIEFVVAVHGLTSQGMYALSFSVSVDGDAPTTVSPGDGDFLIAPSALAWTGEACQTPTMQAQIPPASQDTYYVCPPAS